MELFLRTVVGVRADVQRWFERRTYHATDFAAADLLPHKGCSVSVVLPALNEAGTVGGIVAAIRKELVENVPLVDEIVVIDPGSTDGTADVAALAGASVVTEADILPGCGRVAGKGEALWKSLHVTHGDIVVFVDADLENFDPHLVTGLLAPLLLEPFAGDGGTGGNGDVALVKASYERPLNGGLLPAGGGRVTELVARPLLNAHWPMLAGLVQPLAGEFAARRSLLERIPFVSGYGVEFGMLIDTLDAVGLDAIAQVEVGVKTHQHQADDALGRMAAQIMQVAWWRLGHRPSGAPVPPPTLTQFRRSAAGLTPFTTDVAVTERPPMITVPEYVAGRAAHPPRHQETAR